MNYFSILLVGLCLNNLSIAQKNTNSRTLDISGTVSLSPGQVIPFVTVLIKGTKKASVTNNKGNYLITNVRDGDSIIFTHINFKRSGVKVKGNNLINVTLEPYVQEYPSVAIVDSATKSEVLLPQSQNDEWHIFEKVELNASYKGGQKALFSYLQKGINYPEEAKKKHITGEVLVGFVVGIKGEVKEARIVRGISPECDAEALKAIQGMPGWVCAIQNGRPTESYIEIPVSFTLIDKN